METLSESLRTVAREFDRLLGGGAALSGSRPAGWPSVGEGLLPGTSSDASLDGVRDASSAITAGGRLAGSLLSGLLGAGDGATLQSQIQSFIPGANIPSAVIGNAMNGPLGLLTQGLISLFRRERDPVPYSLYEAPDSLSLDFDMGHDINPAGSAPRVAGRSGTGAGDGLRQPGANASPAVLIQVNAMDARSFADHRDDIATAVREALTRSHSLRDEIWED
ncbi:MAG: hypothetical protein KIT83_05465 [Bryobacterales bacterium]|nr:hypothetical protein [Bryobacterales bacterium]